MKQDLKIREASSKDITQILQLWEKYGDYRRWLDTQKALTQRVQKQGDLILLAEMEEEIIGSVMGSYDGRFAFVARLVVVPDYRRRGIATNLWKSWREGFERKEPYRVHYLSNGTIIQLGRCMRRWATSFSKMSVI